MRVRHRRLGGFGIPPFWHAITAEIPLARPQRAQHYDVAIIGAGFTGLWTAKHLLDRDPAMSIALFDANDVGYGASGRNAGHLTTWMGSSPAALLRLGVTTGSLINRLASESVSDVIDVIRTTGIDCDLDPAHVVYTATNPTMARRIERDLEALATMASNAYRRLTDDELHEKMSTVSYLGGYEDKASATINPLKLVRGVAASVAERGVHLFERTAVRRVETAHGGTVIHTSDGAVAADRVVYGLNAWAANTNMFRRTLLPFYVYHVVTQVLTDDDWKRIGWSGGEAFVERRFFLVDYRKTPDGRLLLGGVDGRQPFGARIRPDYDKMANAQRGEEAALGARFGTSGFTTEFACGGSVAMTSTLLPRVGMDPTGKIGFSHGYCGHGIAQSHFCTSLLVDALHGDTSRLQEIPFFNPGGKRYPREPVRWVGGAAALAEGRWHDKAADNGLSKRDEPALLKLATKILR